MKNDKTLKEARKHGVESMPIATYNCVTPKRQIVLNCHWHEEIELFLTVKGEMKVQCGENFYKVGENSLFIFGSGMLHSATHIDDNDIDFKAILFNLDMLCDNGIIDGKYIQPYMNGDYKIPDRIDFDDRIIELFNELYDIMNSKNIGYELKVKSILYDIFYRLLPHFEYSGNKKISTSSDIVKNCIEFIQENFDSEVTLTQLAKNQNLSVGHLSRLFKKITLKTPIEYLINCRISKSMELLLSTNMKIIDISTAVGFNNQSYFITTFQKNVGVTPSQFRKNKVILSITD